MNSWNPMFNDICYVLDEYDKLVETGRCEKTIDFKNKLKGLEDNNIYYNKEVYNSIYIDQYYNLALFRYDTEKCSEEMWNSQDSMLREARSLVVDLEHREMILTPFRKFFNLGEVEELSYDKIKKYIDECDKNDFMVYEKLDGSMQSFRYIKEKDYIIGSGSRTVNKSISSRLKKGYSLLTINHKKMIKDKPDYTFIFELISSIDVHTIPYNYDEQEGLYLIGIRDVKTGNELSPSRVEYVANVFGVPTAKKYKMRTLDELIDYTNNMELIDGEGFVVTIGDKCKFKIKSSEYLNMGKLFDNLGRKNAIIKLIADGNVDDYMSYINLNPELKEAYEEIKYYDTYIRNEIDKYYNLLVDLNIDKKSLMIEVNKVPKPIREWVRQKLFGNEIHLLTKTVGYIKYNDLKNIFDNLYKIEVK